MTVFVHSPLDAQLYDPNLAPIDEFQYEYRFLSNFFYPVQLDVGDRVWWSTEHLFQASKTRDPEQQELIWRAPTPADAKRVGRSVNLRPDWDQVRDQVMEEILRIKFPPDPANVYTRQLVATGRRALVEGNRWHDQYWGVCYCGRPACQAPGRNRLGVLLMRVRADRVG